MARGQVLSIPNGTGTLVSTLTREEKNSLAVLNPNDGYLFIKMNGPAGINTTQWDWKLPSQSYGLFPGPWQSIGLWYQDQSGSNRSADINVYDNDAKLSVPAIHAVGRAVAAAGTALDISTGSVPANPPSNTVRLWADGSGNLHKLDSTGVDEAIIDVSTPLGGYARGTIPAVVISVPNQSPIYLKDSAGTEVGWCLPWADNNVYYQSLGAATGHIFRTSTNVSLCTIGGDGSLSPANNLYFINGAGIYTRNTSNVAIRTLVHLNDNNVYLWGGSGSYGLVFYNDSAGGFLGYINSTGYHLQIAGGSIYLDSSNSYYIQKYQANFFRTVAMHVMSDGGFYFNANPGINISWDGTGITCTHRFGSTYFSGQAGYTFRCNDSTSDSIYIAPGSALMQFNISGTSGIFRFYTPTNGSYVDFNPRTAYGAIGWNVQVSQFVVAPGFMPNTNSNGWFKGPERGGAPSNEVSAIAHLYVPGTVYCTNTSFLSDRALKDDLTLLDSKDALGLILNKEVNAWRYTWSNPVEGDVPATTKNIGFMSDEMIEVCPEVVMMQEDRPSGINYVSLIPVLWSALRELNERIERLESPV